MIKIHFVLIFLTILSCSSAGNPTNKAGQNIRKQSFQSRCGFNRFLSDPSTPPLAKSIFLNQEFVFTNEEESLALLDSLQARDRISRQFYFKVITIAYPKSDGSFSEAMGMAAKEYVEKNSKEFAGFFDSADCFSTTDLETWADIVLLEMKILSEDVHDTSAIDNFINTIEYTCKSCSQNQKETIDRFAEILRNKWN